MLRPPLFLLEESLACCFHCVPAPAPNPHCLALSSRSVPGKPGLPQLAVGLPSFLGPKAHLPGQVRCHVPLCLPLGWHQTAFSFLKGWLLCLELSLLLTSMRVLLVPVPCCHKAVCRPFPLSSQEAQDCVAITVVSPGYRAGICTQQKLTIHSHAKTK